MPSCLFHIMQYAVIIYCDFSVLRITGMLMIHFSILPLAVSVCCWVFWSWSKREDKVGSKHQVSTHIRLVTLTH